MKELNQAIRFAVSGLWYSNTVDRNVIRPIQDYLRDSLFRIKA